MAKRANVTLPTLPKNEVILCQLFWGGLGSNEFHIK